MNILECSSKNDDETSHKLDKLIRQNAKVIFLRVDQVTGFFFLNLNQAGELWNFHGIRVTNYIMYDTGQFTGLFIIGELEIEVKHLFLFKCLIAN